MPELPPLLLPRPRFMEPLPGRAPSSQVAMAGNPEMEVEFPGKEAYSLHLDTRGARIRARSDQGLALAERTLRQLRRQYGESVPAMHIEDAPAFPIRGVMLDISRDRVPTMAELRKTVDLLAALKFNHLQLYTEHTFAYRGHEEVWRGW